MKIFIITLTVLCFCFVGVGFAKTGNIKTSDSTSIGDYGELARESKASATNGSWNSAMIRKEKTNRNGRNSWWSLRK